MRNNIERECTKIGIKGGPFSHYVTYDRDEDKHLNWFKRTAHMMAKMGYAIDSRDWPQNEHGVNNLIAALPTVVYNNRATMNAIQKYDLKQTGAFLSPCGGIFKSWPELKTDLGLTGRDKPEWLRNIEKELTVHHQDYNADQVC